MKSGYKTSNVIKIKLLKNYSLVGWISNLGVVPLFLLVFFLTAPIFFFLLALRVFVTLVLETINNPPRMKINSKLKMKLQLKLVLMQKLKSVQLAGLLEGTNIVKNFLSKSQYSIFKLKRNFSPLGRKYFLVILIFTLNPLSTSLKALSSPLSLLESKNSQITFLTIGEIITFKLPSKGKFHLSKRSLTKWVYEEKSETLFLEAKKKGETTLTIYLDSQLKNKNIFKRHRLVIKDAKFPTEQVEIYEKLSQLGLLIEGGDKGTIISGLIKRFSTWNQVQSLIPELKPKPINLLNMDEKLFQSILKEKIFPNLNQAHIQKDFVHCHHQNLKIFCKVDQGIFGLPFNQGIFKHLTEEFQIEWIPANFNPQLKNQNFLAQLKLVQMEKSNGEEFSLGLHELSGSYAELFTKGIDGILKEHTFKIGKNDFQLTTLAHPEIILRLNTKASIEVGSQLPIPVTDIRNMSRRPRKIEWKFAGLKVELVINLVGPELFLTYQAEFTKPVEDNIVGNIGRSSINILQETYYQLFEVGLTTTGKELQFFPLLSDIPFLGQIFKSTNNKEQFKKIFCLIIIKKAPHQNSLNEKIKM
jgi:hypothetical protein